MPRAVSPAAAAGVSRALAGAGLPKSVEIRGRLFLEGYVAEPYGDHVRVEWDPGSWKDDAADEALAVATAGIARCEEALEGKSYEVRRVTGKVAAPGGWVERPVLELRKPEWTMTSRERFAEEEP